MLKYILRTCLLLLCGFFAVACGNADDPRFVAPADREPLVASKPWPRNHFLVLAWHDVEDNAADQRYLSVRTSALNDQLSWLGKNGYHPISVQQIIDAHNGGPELPPKAVLLSFDDGYSSFYTRVWPMLAAYNYPALWAPVGSWVDTPENQKVDFGGLMSQRDKFATWEMVKEVSKSPLVEIGSHTWNSHFGILANPQGSKQPAAANREYELQTRQYESDDDFSRRIDNDVSKITEKIKQVTGKAPRAWVWPYGAGGGTSLKILKSHGYQLAFTLRSGLANTEDLDSIPRLLISGNPAIDTFASAVANIQEPRRMRVMHIDLDYVYDANPRQQQKNIDALIQRVYDMKITHVFLQAYADPQGTGTVKALYFPNSHLPMRADLFNFVAWQLQTRAGATVYAWMPVLAFDLNKSLPRVMSWDPQTGRSQVDSKQYQRLSPWDPTVRQQITEIYQDLARRANFSGILFHDDALLSDFEDASPVALAAYQKAGFPGSIAAIRSDPQTFARWTRFKSRMLIDFTLSLKRAVADIRGPQIRTARNIYASPILEPESEAWFAQNFNDFLHAYDWTAPMAMPLMEGVPLNKSNEWLDNLVSKVAEYPGALDKTVFELQARDWRTEATHEEISGKQLARWMQQLQLSGASSYGYYPDDFINNKPEMSVIRPELSNYWYPQK